MCKKLQLITYSNITKGLPTSVVQVQNYCLQSKDILALSQALKINLTVVKLDLSGNSIGPQGVKYLSRMLEENSTITNLVCHFIKND
jgi:Ran GTPase-activating protein (RanGAP) involved in mRNA processing and transport